MKVWIDGGKAVSLSQPDFVGQGGQGQVYARGDRAFKIYSDPRAALHPGKLRELGRIQHDSVLVPEAMILDRKGDPIGFRMPFVPDSFTLCQTFPRAFRERHGITDASVMKLVEQLREAVEAVHRAGALIVDLNEMNVLVSSDLKDLYLIDVDSFATANHPPTGVMETIRDRHSSTFSEVTDWFSFAIVTFQMFVGIHPFKGKHATLRGLDARMQANVSVLNKDVRMPQSVYPLDVIPAAYRSWYEAVFEHGRRIAPPVRGAASPALVPKVTRVPVNGANVVSQELESFPETVLDYWSTSGGLVAQLQSGLMRGGRALKLGSGKLVGIMSLGDGTPMAVVVDAGRVVFVDTQTGSRVRLELALARPVVHADRLYGISGGSVFEIGLSEVAGTVIPSPREVVRVLPHATQLFSGTAIQNLLGSTYASLFQEPGAAAQVRLSCLDPYQIVDARYVPGHTQAAGRRDGGGVLVVIASRNGVYDRLTIRFSANHDHHDVRVVSDVIPTSANFAVLDSGVVVSLNEDEDLELFKATPGDPAIKIVSDAGIDGQMILSSRRRELLFARGNGIYSLCMQHA